MEEQRLNQLTEKIIGCAFKVSNTLGSGFLEKVYENAMIHELSKSGIAAEKQKAIQVIYDDIVVGDYVADLIVENMVIVELKAVKELDDIHWAQCMNYLKATKMKVCLLMNFGKPKIEIRRIIN